MEVMMIFITMLCIISLLTLLQTPYAEASLQIQLQPSHDQQAYYSNEVRLSLPPLLPRKLRVLTVQIKGHAAQGKISHNNPKEDVQAGNKNRVYKKEKGSGTWEEGDTSQYFTMDYSHVRRRRPIHNQSLPAAAP